MRGEGVFPPIHVMPLETYYGGTNIVKNGPAEFTPLDDENKPLKPQGLEPNFVYKSIQPYELVALTKLDKLRKEHKVDDYEELLAEEQVVSAVLRFHSSAKASGQRKGDWSDIEHQLRIRLMEVMLKQFNLVTEAADWESAFTLASRLADTFPSETEQQVIAPLILEMVQKALKAKSGPSINTTQLRDIHLRLRALTEQFPGNQQMQKLKQSLRIQAEKLLAEATVLEKSTNKKDLESAQEKLNQAAELWPTLPGLENHQLNVNRKARVLKVGAPARRSTCRPNTAVSDSELRAVEMIFESLVKFSPGASGMGHYHHGAGRGATASRRTGPSLPVAAERPVVGRKNGDRGGPQRHPLHLPRPQTRGRARSLAGLGESLRRHGRHRQRRRPGHHGEIEQRLSRTAIADEFEDRPGEGPATGCRRRIRQEPGWQRTIHLCGRQFLSRPFLHQVCRQREIQQARRQEATAAFRRGAVLYVHRRAARNARQKPHAAPRSDGQGSRPNRPHSLSACPCQPTAPHRTAASIISRSIIDSSR